MFPRRRQPPAEAPGQKMENCSIGINSVGGGTVKNCTVHIGLGIGSRKDKEESPGLDLEDIKKAFIKRYNILKAADPGHDQIKGFNKAEEYATAQVEALKAAGLGEEEEELELEPVKFKKNDVEVDSSTSSGSSAAAKEEHEEGKTPGYPGNVIMAFLVLAMFTLLLGNLFAVFLVVAESRKAEANHRP